MTPAFLYFLTYFYLLNFEATCYQVAHTLGHLSFHVLSLYITFLESRSEVIVQLSVSHTNTSCEETHRHTMCVCVCGLRKTCFIDPNMSLKIIVCDLNLCYSYMRFRKNMFSLHNPR